MRIVYIGAFRLPCYDAAAARVLNVARSLREGGHEVRFISWGGVQREEDKCDDGCYRVDGFTYFVTNELPQNGMSFMEKLKIRLCRGKTTKKMLMEWLGQIDVIFTYNNCLCRWLVPFCKKRSIKLVNDITEWYAYNELKPTDWFDYAYEMYCRQKHVMNKIVISSYLDHFYKTTHNIVVPATCDGSEPKWHKNADYAKKFVPPFDGITLIYAGNPAKKDMVHHVINAVHRLASEGCAIRFLIVGTTRESYISRYSSMLNNTNLHDNIYFLGRMSQEVIPSFYNQADFMALLRDQTRKSNAGFPTKFAESFTSGTPVIANLTSDLSKFLKNGETGFIVDESTEDAVYRLLKKQVLPLDKNEIARMKDNVHKYSRLFDYHFYVEPLKKFMVELK